MGNNYQFNLFWEFFFKHTFLVKCLLNIKPICSWNLDFALSACVIVAMWFCRVTVIREIFGWESTLNNTGYLLSPVSGSHGNDNVKDKNKFSFEPFPLIFLTLPTIIYREEYNSKHACLYMFEKQWEMISQLWLEQRCHRYQLISRCPAFKKNLNFSNIIQY